MVCSFLIVWEIETARVCYGTIVQQVLRNTVHSTEIALQSNLDSRYEPLFPALFVVQLLVFFAQLERYIEV